MVYNYILNLAEKNRNYSFAVALLALLSSIISWLSQFNSASPFWICSGFSIIVSTILIMYGSKSIFKYLSIPSDFVDLYRLLIFVITIIFYLSSAHGLIVLIDLLPIRDTSYLFIPFLSFLFCP